MAKINPIMTIELQIKRLKEIFEGYNRGINSDVIDWFGEIDRTLHLDENLSEFASRHPEYVWGVEEMISPELEKLRESVRRVHDLERRLKELEKIVPEEEILKLREELEKQKKIAEEREKQIEEIGKRKPEEVVPAREYKDLKRSVEKLTERLHEMDIILTKTLKEVKEKAPPAEIVIPPERAPEVNTTTILIPDEVAIGREVAALSREKYGKEAVDLTPKEAAEVYNEAVRIVEAAGKFVGRMPQVEEVLKRITDRKGKFLFPEEKVYWTRRYEFYPWWEDIPVRLYKYIEQDHIISRIDLERMGIPTRWLDEQILEGSRRLEAHSMRRI